MERARAQSIMAINPAAAIGFMQKARCDTARGTASSMGLQGMRERLELMQGRLDISATPGVGVEVVAEMPLP